MKNKSNSKQITLVWWCLCPLVFLRIPKQNQNLWITSNKLRFSKNNSRCLCSKWRSTSKCSNNIKLCWHNNLPCNRLYWGKEILVHNHHNLSIIHLLWECQWWEEWCHHKVLTLMLLQLVNSSWWECQMHLCHQWEWCILDKLILLLICLEVIPWWVLTYKTLELEREMKAKNEYELWISIYFFTKSITKQLITMLLLSSATRVCFPKIVRVRYWWTSILESI